MNAPTYAPVGSGPQPDSGVIDPDAHHVRNTMKVGVGREQGHPVSRRHRRSIGNRSRV